MGPNQARVRLVYRIIVLLAFLLLINFIVAGMLMHMEPVSYTDAFFFAMSATTLAGFNAGPINDVTKWFISFYQLFASAIWTYIVMLVCLSVMDRQMLLDATD